MVTAKKKSKVLKKPKVARSKLYPGTKKVKIKTNSDGIMFATLEGIRVEEGFNIRNNVTPEPDLVESIRINGVIHPVHVRWSDKEKEHLSLIDGERRLVAATEVGLGSIPITHHGSLGNKEARIISLAGNRNQKKWTKKELLKGFRELNKDGLSPGQIARVMAIDARTVDEALRVDSKGVKELKEASKKGSRDGGVAPRAAARASSLPEDVQKKLVPKMKGKPMDDQLEEVRKEEKRLKLARPGRKTKRPRVGKPKSSESSSYRLAEDFVSRCQSMERILNREIMKRGGSDVRTGQMMIIKCLKGQCEITDVFGWKNV